jgi:hypothetical protein
MVAWFALYPGCNPRLWIRPLVENVRADQYGSRSFWVHLAFHLHCDRRLRSATAAGTESQGVKGVLREIKETENRIYATEKTVRELMLKLADLAAMETLNFSRLSGSEYAQLMRQWRDKRVDEILDLVEATPEEKNHLRRYAPIYKGIDDANALPVPPPQRDEAAAPFWQQLRDLFRSEISDSKSD